MRIAVRSRTDLAPAAAREVERWRQAVTSAVRRTVRDLKLRLRADTRPVLGNRIANAWRDAVYPAPPKTSAEAAGRVFSKAPKIIDAWERGTPVRARSGRMLAIPLPTAPKKVRGRRVSPSRMREAGWELRAVRDGRGRLLLVGTNASIGRTGRLRRAGKRARERGHVAWVPLFLLVPQVRFPKVFDLQRDARAAHMLLAVRIAEWMSR
ncbi:MAG TPA: hypothetical protein ENJ38_00105 [Rhodospirillales bacterium]|nr:hypothetical protein [Rhodospirillales bacterium]